tara:strand:- start:175 stop:606 length:432 start_codon:yes stop_codon:yes gene_type:complete
MDNKDKTQKHHFHIINLINQTESIYASWLRNMIIIIGAGITLYKMKDSFKLHNFYINLISYVLIIGGSLLGIITYITYNRRISAIKELSEYSNVNTKNDNIFDIFLNDRYIWLLTLFINIIYIFLVVFILLEVFNSQRSKNNN